MSSKCCRISSASAWWSVDMTAEIPAPIGLLAELTHRCPLRCPYCSNPLELDRRSSELDTETWLRVLGEAAALGVLHVHLSGGEPTARPDLEQIVAHCAKEGLYTKDRKSTRLNSSHANISYAVFCLNNKT